MRTFLALTLLTAFLGATAATADFVDPKQENSVATATAGAPPAVVCPKPGATVVAAASDESLSGQIKSSLAAGNFLFALLLVMVGGLLTALSPCVYPLIPIFRSRCRFLERDRRRRRFKDFSSPAPT
jgi:thiol:disulfide interchange protein